MARDAYVVCVLTLWEGVAAVFSLGRDGMGLGIRGGREDFEARVSLGSAMGDGMARDTMRQARVWGITCEGDGGGSVVRMR